MYKVSTTKYFHLHKTNIPCELLAVISQMRMTSGPFYMQEVINVFDSSTRT